MKHRPFLTRVPALPLRLALAWLALPAWASAAPPTLRGLGVDETLRSAPRLAPILSALGSRPADVPLFVRLAVDQRDLEPEEGRFELEALSERVGLYHRLGVSVVLDLGPVRAADAESTGWRALVRAVATRCQGRVRAYQLAAPGEGALEQSVFSVRLAAVQVRAADPEALVILDGLARLPTPDRAILFSEALAPYVDGLALTFDPSEGSGPSTLLGAFQKLIEAADPDAGLVVGEVPLGEDPAQAVRSFLRWEFSHPATAIALTTFEASPAALASVLRAAGSFSDALYGEVVPLDTAASELSLSGAAGELSVTQVRRHLLYNTRRFATYLAYWAEDDEPNSLRVTLKEPSGRPPVIRNGLGSTVARVQDFSWDAATNRASMNVPLSSTPLLVDFNYATGETQATRVDVTERILPTVGEIIFRHQQVQAAQDAVLHNYVANVRMEQHFRPSATDPGWDVASDNVLYADRSGVEWEETSFTLNGSRWGPDRPPFPLLQPEKVLSLPLDLRLNADYSYRLDGTATEAGRECYVLHFAPVSDEKPLYRGTVWIDTQTFEKVKLQAVQTRPGTPVLSNEEVHHFAPAGAAGGRPLTLLQRLTVRQIILIAGRNLLLEREVRFSGYRLNAPDFLALRDASRKSDNVMYRDTDGGLRYLVKKGDERVVADRPTSSAKALAFGTVVDPSYDYPLPIVGLNYLDFDFIGKDSQLALLFGGVLALVNVQRPQVLGRRVDASLDLFAIAIYARDQVFASTGEREGEELQTRPFSTGLNLGYQFTDFQKITASYVLRYDAYTATDNTAPDFLVPTSTFTQGLGLAYEYRRWGYTLQATGSLYRRVDWEPWGREGDYDPSQRDYAKYGVSLAKDFFSGIHKFRINAAYFGGRDLDRFSMYQFGLFDETRIHGVPTAGVRFPELAMLRGSYSLSILELYRLDLFVDQALGRDPVERSAWRSITGLGIGFNLRGPFRTLVRGEIGKSFLPEVYSSAGSFNAQITFFKPI